MNLFTLTLTADAAGWTQAAPADKGTPGEAGPGAGQTVPDGPCAFCGVRSGEWRQTGNADASQPDKASQQLPACPLCALALHLERPRIDEEATLIWCPEMSQAAINVTLREIHRRLRLLGDDLHADDRPSRDEPERYPLHHARAALALRAREAASRLGSALPSDLARALLRLSPATHARRAALLGGIRLLPLGRFFVVGEDVYPRVVDTWLGVTTPVPERSRLGPMSWLPRRAGTPAATAAPEPVRRQGF